MGPPSQSRTVTLYIREPSLGQGNREVCRGVTRCERDFLSAVEPVEIPFATYADLSAAIHCPVHGKDTVGRPIRFVSASNRGSLRSGSQVQPEFKKIRADERSSNVLVANS
jgi:hypothetical protein